jgi:hypothetical protein
MKKNSLSPVCIAVKESSWECTVMASITDNPTPATIAQQAMWYWLPSG